MDRLERAKERKRKRGRQRENIRIVTLNRWLPLLPENVRVREGARKELCPRLGIHSGTFNIFIFAIS